MTKQWDKIFFNRLSIKAETESALLIYMPNKSAYKGYAFWHPRKLVKEHGGKGYHYSFSFTSDFVFRLKKYGQGKYNRYEIINQRELSSDEMKKAFGVVNENVNHAVECETDTLYEQTIERTVIENHVPEKTEPLSDNIISELKK